MKRIKTVLIIMAVMVVAAIGIYFTAKHLSNKNKEEAIKKANELVIFDFDSNDANNLKIKNESGEYEMHYTQENGWRMTNKVDFDANSYTANYICSVMSNLTAERIIKNDSDTSKFGFDNAIDLTVTANSKDYTLHIGDITPTNESFYVMKEGSDSIYLISYQNGLVLSATKDALKDPYLADMFSSEVKHFAFWKGSETDENILFSMEKDSDGIWSMSKPYTDMMIYSANVTEYLDMITTDRVSRFIEENCPESSYSKYGFDNPQYVFEITDENKTKKVIFGNDTNNDTEIYGLYTDNGQVVIFEKDNIMVLNYTTTDMMNKEVYRKTSDEIYIINVKTNDFEVTLEYSEEKYKLNDNEISPDNSDLYAAYFTFFDSVNEAYFDEIDRKVTPNGDAEMTVKYVLSDGTETVIEYIPGAGDDANSYWVVMNGKYSGFIVREKVIKNILSNYQELEKFMK